MVAKLWRGDAPAVAQVNTITVGGTAALGQVYSVVMNGKAVSTTATGADTNNTIAAALQAALAASVIPEFAEVTWTVAANVVTGTVRTAGVPFASTSSATGTGTLVTATATASSGPSDWSTAANWLPPGVPANADDVSLDGTVSILYGLNQSGVTPNSLTVLSTFTGQCGLTDYNTTGGYAEYRTTALTFAGCPTLSLPAGSGSGSPLIRLFTGAGNVTGNVAQTGSPLEAGKSALRWAGTGATSVWNVTGGSVGLCEGGEAGGGLAALRVGAGSVAVTCGANLGTIATLTQAGGTVTFNGNVTTLTKTDGTTHWLGGNVTTWGQDAGVLYYRSAGTGGTGALRGGTLDLSQDARARSWTLLNVYKGATVLDPLATFSNSPFKVVGCALADVNLNFGPDKMYTAS